MHDTWVTEGTLKYPKRMFKNTVNIVPQCNRVVGYFTSTPKLIMSSTSFKNANNFLNTKNKTKNKNKNKYS